MELNISFLLVKQTPLNIGEIKATDYAIMRGADDHRSRLARGWASDLRRELVVLLSH